jgi:hypothetical protein
MKKFGYEYAELLEGELPRCVALTDSVLLGDAKSSLGDIKSSLGDAESSLGDAESSLGDIKSSRRVTPS